MGRLLKAPRYTLKIPAVPTSGPTPSHLEDGLIRYNKDTDRVQFSVFDTNMSPPSWRWRDIAPVGLTDVLVHTAVGDGDETVFTLPTEARSRDVMVFIGGVYQQPPELVDNGDGTYSEVGGNYSVTGNQITFTSPPPAPTGLNPNKINVIYDLNSTDAV